MTRINVVVYGGAIEQKVLVEDLGDIVLITTEEEWKMAESEERAPVSVGFKREYICKASD